MDKAKYEQHIQDKVERGLELLDAHRPGWAHKIDIRILSLESSCNCILGQLFGDYVHGQEKLDIEDGSNYGFDWDIPLVSRYRESTELSDGVAVYYRILQSKWEEALADRVEASNG